MADPRLVDPRAPRFAAGITSVLLLIATLLSLTGVATARAVDWYFGPDTGAATFGWITSQPVRDFAFVAGAWALPTVPVPVRAADPGFLALLVVAVLFLWGAVSPRTAPWAALYRVAIQPRLSPPPHLEDARPPRFAQTVGLTVSGVGLVLHLLGVPFALPLAAALAFVAAFLNAAFGLCLGCLLWLLLQRIGLVGRRA